MLIPIPARSVAPAVSCLSCPLRATGAFKRNTPEELAFLQSFKQAHVAVAAGQAIVWQGQPAPLSTLFSGWAFRFKLMSDGRRQILNFVLPGDLIGLQDQSHELSPHGVEALTDVELCRFDEDRLWTLYRRFPKLGYDVTWLAAHEESLVDENLLSVGRRNAAERIAALMVHLYKRAVSLGMAREGRVPWPVTQQHIADAVGLSLVHTNKTLRRLYRQGLFAVDEGWLYLPDPNMLHQLADYYAQPVPQRPLI
ncbi:Crp/Fnr family transcriptional regulator [Aquincola sp. MAHUQ-54]|uniref:Crp/Fnr family transcriptional regulator n=1 Tax=Aquincola agrisoli TaxID=3119538 RepID=A0AAW9QGV5_9BURK